MNYSMNYYNTNIPKNQLFFPFLQHLHEGERNAIRASTLSALAGVPPRKLRRQIRAARLAGIPVCSSSNPIYPGYFLPETREEAARFFRREKARAFEVERSASCAFLGGSENA